jgi:hypothetical protein
MLVENSLDELGIGVKGQPWMNTGGGRALDGLGALPGYQTQPNSECRRVISGSQSVRAKLHGRKGNNPAHQLRSPSAV